jgi:Ca-activated chloride channel family protein
MRRTLPACLFTALLGTALPATGCETALLLMIDVSGSIDHGEYLLQTGGLADALGDPEVADALVLGQVALAVVQWSGSGQQALSLPWKRMLSYDAVAGFAAAARALDRAFDGSDTAVGDAIGFSVDQFAPVSDCRRSVIDISGDGPVNAGRPVAPERGGALRAGIEINAIAIEDVGRSVPITEFYRRLVITPNGFVLTARGLADYPRAIREKLIRETAKPLG